jgi:hypothetical protein
LLCFKARSISIECPWLALIFVLSSLKANLFLLLVSTTSSNSSKEKHPFPADFALSSSTSAQPFSSSLSRYFQAGALK